KHTDLDFFEGLIKDIADHLAPNGCCWLVLPVALTEILTGLAASQSIYPQKIINVYSYIHSEAHRVIICFGFAEVTAQISKFTIYKAAGTYSEEYQRLLQPYFLAF
ncbi:MAG TPA: hypothetical protein DCO83_08950, partial [Mucilaginibacter sp.]|nr:hypothetical protein [Mucilaginibacter sp.]